MGVPSGTVTFLFTDIEGSTQMWESAPDAMRAAVAWHDSILRGAIEGQDGYVFSTSGDGFAAAFTRAGEALVAATKAQTALAAEQWPEEAVIRVRMALHSGEATERDGNYFGGAVNRAARLMAIGYGGQILASAATAELLTEPDLVDLGEHRLRDLDRPMHVYQIGVGRFPPLRSLDAWPGNLPLQVSSFIGRSEEIECTVAALGESRVVTLTGVSGVGKTRLALQVAAEVLPRFTAGAWLVEMAPVNDPGAVAAAAAALFNVAPRGGQTMVEALVEFLQGKHLLLIVDNCEHLLDAIAAVIESVERSCPHVAVLATSQEGLGVAGEQMLTVGPLTSPAEDATPRRIADAAAVQLFVERAKAVKADFIITPDNARAVADVCRRLDGVPLAIELAAARAQAMSPAELARRLDRRFELLAGGRRGAVERHHTLRAAIDWSFDLLAEPHQRLLARLTVFAGGWALEAAEAVCAGGPVAQAAIWEELAVLVARSLVVAERNGPDTRYRLLETIRQYGDERLDEQGETAELRRRHAEYYATLSSRLSSEYFGLGQVETLALVAADQENLTRAMSFALDAADAELAFQLLCTLPAPAAQVGFAVHLPAEPVLALPGAAEHRNYAYGLAIAAMQAALRGNLELGEQLCREATEVQRDAGGPDRRVDLSVAAARNNIAWATGSWEDAARFNCQWAEIARSAGQLGATAWGLAGAAQCHAMIGELPAAIDLATEAVSLARQVGIPYVVAYTSCVLANALAESEPERAARLLRESIDLNEAHHYENVTEIGVAVITAAHLRDRRLTLELARRALRLLQWNNDRAQLAGMLNVVAWAAVSEPATAARLQGAARHLALGVQPRPAARQSPVGTDAASVYPTGARGTAGFINDLRHETKARIADVLGDARQRELNGEGETIDSNSAVVLALELIDRVARRSEEQPSSSGSTSDPGY